MEKEIIFGIIGMVLGYIIYKWLMFRQSQKNDAEEMFSDILNNEEYKVKGQHDYLKE